MSKHIIPEENFSLRITLLNLFAHFSHKIRIERMSASFISKVFTLCASGKIEYFVGTNVNEWDNVTLA